MNIPTDAIVMTIALIVGFIYFRAQKKTGNSSSTKESDDSQTSLPHPDDLEFDSLKAVRIKKGGPSIIGKIFNFDNEEQKEIAISSGNYVELDTDEAKDAYRKWLSNQNWIDEIEQMNNIKYQRKANVNPNNPKVKKEYNRTHNKDGSKDMRIKENRLNR